MKHDVLIKKLTRRQKADLLTGRDFWSTLAIKEIGLPSAYLADGPHGIRRQAAASDHLGLNTSIPATCFPTASAMANSWNPALGERMGELLGAEAAAQNVNILLGPGLNIKRNPLCGRNFEYFSEDPYLAGKMAASYVRGIQKNGISACLKHFAANNQEERRMVIDSIIDERTLREIYLTGFEIAVDEGKPHAIMSSYNLLNGEFANENKHLMQDILREEWQYDGIVVTDWAGCNDRVAGIRCGNELEMPVCRYGADDVYKALEEGELDENLVDECLDRLIELILTTDKNLKKAPKQFDEQVHHSFARKCAEESIVLLKNENNALPIKEEKVCFIGDFADKPRYQGAGSSTVNPTVTERFIEVEKNYSFHFVGYEKGFHRFGKKSEYLAKKAILLAKQADTIIYFMGLDEVTEAEGLDRKNTLLPVNQIELLRRLKILHKKIVVVLFCGGVVELGVVADCADAIVHSYLGGQAGVSAMLNILSGKVNPSGKLAESYAMCYRDYSSSSHFPGTELTVEYREGIYVGYRYFTSANVKTRFPFGYGLSYTQFTYSDLLVDENGVSFRITNIGKMDGSEIAQLYIGKAHSATFRPNRELKGFSKVFIKAGESVVVNIPFDRYSFRVYNTKAKAWQVESGEYQIMVGASSTDIRLQGSIIKEGNASSFSGTKDWLPDYYNGTVSNVDRKQFERLLGRILPRGKYSFYKKNRIVIHENSTVADLQYSKRWVGRFFSWTIKFMYTLLWKLGKRTQANTLIMGIWHLPIRGLAKFGRMSRRQMESLIMIFNGHLLKGIGRFLSKEKR